MAAPDPGPMAAADPGAVQPTGPRPLTPEEQATARAYARALQKGRNLTEQKKYDEAIATFDLALKAIPDDPTALAQRGYARLLKKDTPGARADFMAALGQAPSRTVRASTLFNLGKLEELDGNLSLSQEYFTMAKEERALKVQASGAGPGTCPVKVERPLKAPTIAANWPELLKKIVEHHAGDQGCDGLTRLQEHKGLTPEVIRKNLLDTEKASLWGVMCENSWSHHLVAELPDGRPAIHFDVARRTLGEDCRSGSIAGRLVRVVVPSVTVDRFERRLTLYCHAKLDREQAERITAYVPEEPCPENVDERAISSRTCATNRHEVRHLFFDPATWVLRLVVTEVNPIPGQPGYEPGVKLVSDPQGVTLEGPGCNSRRELF